jgi:hypothetical protein
MTKRLPISEEYPWDRKVEELTRKGLTCNAIMRYVPLTEGQIRGRQQKLSVSALDYRQGRSPEAMQAIRKADKAMGTAAILLRRINAMFPDKRSPKRSRGVVGKGRKDKFQNA